MSSVEFKDLTAITLKQDWPHREECLSPRPHMWNYFADEDVFQQFTEQILY